MRLIRFSIAILLFMYSLSVDVHAGKINLKDSRHEDYRGTPRLEFPDASASKAKSADEYLRAESARFKIPADLSNLEVVEVRHSLTGTHTRYRQLLNGLPVEGAEIVVSQRKTDGSIFQVYNNTYPVEIPVHSAKTTVSKDEALQKAWDHLHVYGRLKYLPRADMMYVPFKRGFRLVYKTLIIVDGPFGYWEHKVDAISGEVMSVRRHEVSEKYRADEVPDFSLYKGPTTSLQDELNSLEQVVQPVTKVTRQVSQVSKTTEDGTALVFDPDPRTALANAALVNSSPTSSFNAAYVARTLKDITRDDAGVYRLQGPWVAITNLAAELPATAVSASTNGIWTAKRGNNAFNDVMCYFHIDQNQRYLQSLGYTNAAGIQALPIPVDTDGLKGDDNSHYVPAQNYLAFGHGGVPDPEDADVIIHEYGHAITYGIISNWGGGDTGAIGEGFGDYWGGSYSWSCSNGSTFHPEWAFSWDGHSMDTWSGRMLDMTNLTYDSSHTYIDHETISGIDNYSDQLWSAPIYMAFRDLISLGAPREEMDKIIIESFFGVGYGVKMPDLANATVQAAMELFPTGQHANVYYSRFTNQLILTAASLPVPTLVYPAGGEYFATGATVNVQWNRNGAPLDADTVIEYSSQLDGNGSYFYDNVEAGSNGWAATKTTARFTWAIATSKSHSPSKSWFAADDTRIGDEFLTRSSISVSNGAVLSFWHSYDLEAGYDGGVVEVSTNGTTWIDIGVNATLNGYNDTIDTGYGSPIAGRKAFSGLKSSFIETRIPLDNYAGKTISLRFRESNDSSAAATGWWIDDIRIYIGASWTPLVTTTNASSYSWVLPAESSTNYGLRLKFSGSNYADSGWAASSAFTIITNRTPADILLSNAALSENQPTGTLAGVLGTIDPDRTNTFTYALVSGTGDTDNGSFTISESNLLSLAVFDREVQGSCSIRVSSTDQGGLSCENILTVIIQNVNEAPTGISLSSSILPENQPAGTKVGSFATMDPDATNTFVYALVAGAGSTDNASFTVDGSNLLTAVSFDYEAKTNYDIRVRSTDQGLLSVEQQFSVAVSNMNDYYNLTVLSGKGVSVPDGTNSYHLNTPVSVAVTNSSVTTGTTQFTCKGWTGTGSAPASGSATNTGSFNISTDSTVTWLWHTNFWLLTFTSGNGTVNTGNGLYVPGDKVTIRARPAAGYPFVGWSGDTNGATISTTNITVKMTSAKSITANFGYYLNVQAQGLDGLSKVVTVAVSPKDYANKTSVITSNRLSYPTNTVVSLSAPGTLTGGWKLYGWSGVDSSSGTNASVMLTNNTLVKALYDPLPKVTITNPTSAATYSTTNGILAIRGTASNRCAIVRVEFSNNRSERGICAGTNSWSYTNGITLYAGANIITVTAYDIYSNAAIDTLTVTYKPKTAILQYLALLGGAVVRYIDMPDNLVPGTTNTIQWQVESYEPVLSGIKIRLPSGGSVTNITLNGVLSGSSNGIPVIGAWQSEVYSYSADWIVPNVSTGACRVRFMTARQDGFAYMNANIPAGTDPLNRPYGTDGKEIVRNIVAGGTAPAIQNEVLTKAAKLFETLTQARYRSGATVQNIQIPDNVMPGSVVTCKWSILSYPALKTRMRIDLPVEKDLLGLGLLKTTSTNVLWRLPSTGKIVEYHGAIANDSLAKVTTYYSDKLRNYQYVWTVPNDPGTCRIGFEVAPSTLTNWINAILPENVDGQIETNQVQILRDVVTNGASTVALVVGGTNITGNISYFGDADWYQFVSTGGVYSIETTAVTLTDTIMKLYGPDDQGAFLDLNDNAVALMSRITRTLAPGTYYVKVTAPLTKKGTYKILCKITDPAVMASTYELQVAQFASIYNKTVEWKNWMVANKARYNTAFLKSKARPGTITISFRYETVPLVYTPAWVDENEHMAVFKTMAQGAYPSYNFSFVVNGNTTTSYANIIAGTAGTTSYAYGKNVYLYYETIFNHEFGHVMGLLHHYDTLADMGNGSHMPPGDTECIMDRTSSLYCSACRTALGIPLDISDAASVDAAITDILSRYPY